MITRLNIYILFLELDFQSTRSSVECGVPQEETNTGEANRVSTIVTIASPCSTNSSMDEYHGIDRSTFDDAQYGNERFVLVSSESY